MYVEFQGSRPKNGVIDANGTPYWGEGVPLGSKMCSCQLCGSKKKHENHKNPNIFGIIQNFSEKMPFLGVWDPLGDPIFGGPQCHPGYKSVIGT